MTPRLLPVGAFVCLFREALESDPLYSDLWLEGEITDLSRSSAGHVYFSLRDDDGCLKCVLFRSQALRQYQVPKVGDQTIVHGGLSMYTRSGSMQLVADLVRPAGLGHASLELEYLRQRLEDEGLFDPLRKRPLPATPRMIGVVTSEYGAAWHDIVDVIGRRYPLAKLILAPAQVQGDGAPESIVRALQTIAIDSDVDVIILARGGGASDDLSAFNDERVVRAIFASRVPVVTGIGHATDRTLVEDVADLQAPTPSAAAEMCVPSVAELNEHIQALAGRLTWSFATQQADIEMLLQVTSRRLIAVNPVAGLRQRHAVVEFAAGGLRRSVTENLARASRDVDAAVSVLAALEPAAVLRRGYAAIQRVEDGQPVFSIAQVQPGTAIVARLEDGSVRSVVGNPVSASSAPLATSR